MDPLDFVVLTHQRVEDLRLFRRERNRAFAEAHDAGYSYGEIGAAIGKDRSWVHTCAKQHRERTS